MIGRDIPDSLRNRIEQQAERQRQLREMHRRRNEEQEEQEERRREEQERRRREERDE